MVVNLLTKLFGSRNERVIKQLQRTVTAINALEAGLEPLSDDELRQRSAQMRERHQAGETLDQLLPEAFALVREAAKRTLGMRHYDVQLIGGAVLHDGKIAEMRTGEGKTLMSTLAVYLNALTGRGVHVVTVNDYLARRDADWMGEIYRFLGLTVGVILQGQEHAEKKAAYACDITYGTNNEFGFDYLRDNMAFSLEEKVMRDTYFAVVDEVDSILIDEARTPLIISGPTSDSSALYTRIDQLIPKLTRQAREESENAPPLTPEERGDYFVEEKHKQVFLTEEGHQKVEEMLIAEGLLGEGESLYDTGHIGLMHHVNAGLRAHALFQKDVDYIVRDNQIIIVDEFTGRTMPGRRWSEGLHQAIEAKERVRIQRENQTLASITFQNYFRLYDKLGGMTGTADTEAYEFQNIYKLEVVVIPTHRPMIRDDRGDLVYISKEEKYEAILEDILDCKKRGQPVLVGTTSVESSELISNHLRKAKVEHQVLNAKHHAQEAQVIANAGRPGTVTIATNMAGRGTDIVLGGSREVELKEARQALLKKNKLKESGEEQIELPPELAEQWQQTQAKCLTEWEERHQAVLDSGGLHIIGTERHESRRIDNQLRGRSGRQGDAGSSRFYLSLEDNLMRIFASDKLGGMMQRLGMERGEAIEHPWVTKAIENAQRKVEAHNFDIRKNLLEYDDVANEQRKAIYGHREYLMRTDDVSEDLKEKRERVVVEMMAEYIPPGSIEEQWDVANLEKGLRTDFGREIPVQKWLDEDHDLHEESLRDRLLGELNQAHSEKEELIGGEMMRRFEKAIMLQVLDQQWKEHLAAMDYLRQGIHLRGYAQKNPKQEYKRESFEMFEELLSRIDREVVNIIARVEIQGQPDVESVERKYATAPTQLQTQHAHTDALNPEEAEGTQSKEAAKPETVRREGRKIGRNEPCWCGSGKKFKHCHGKLE